MTKEKKAYVVLVGLKPGVYKKWLEASPHVTGVSENQHQGFENFEDAVEFYERAQRNGKTRTVTKPPTPDEKPQDKGGRHQARRGGQERQPRRRQDGSSPAASVQTPTSTSKGSSAGKAARDAQIAAALASAIEPSASGPSVISSETSQSNKPSGQAAPARSATEGPAYHLEHSSRVCESKSARTPPPCSVRRTIELPTLEPELETLPHTPKMKLTSESCGSVSDITTDKTQTKNHFTNSPGLSTPRYAQSLSYASPTSPSSLGSSDLRKHLSSPSSCSTRYFPEDWPERHGRRRESNDSGWRRDDQSSVLSSSEYVTAPNTPERGSMELEDEVEDMRGVPSLSTSKRSGVEWSEPSPKRQHRSNRDQTSSVASLLRASAAVRDVPVRPLPGGDSDPCACEHPEYACINCGQRPRIKASNARSAAGQSNSSMGPSTMAITASHVPPELLSASASSSRAGSGTPASAIRGSVRTRSSSSRLHGGGHTPIMGPSETRVQTRPPSARIQETLGMVNFAEAGRGIAGVEPVVHDVSFDPRSPIQRGTSIPAGTSGSAVRPSPAMALVPMGSLGLFFPS